MSSGAGRTIPDGNYAIVPVTDAGWFLDIPGVESPAEPESNVWLCPLEDEMMPWDVWTVTYIDDGGFYSICQMDTDIALDVYLASLEPGANVHVAEANGTDAQKWSISPLGDGYRLQAKCSGYALDIKAQNALQNPVNEGANAQRSYQCWSFRPYLPAGSTLSGTCGEKLNWTLDSEGTLTISGSGAMTNVTNVSQTPWYGAVIRRVVIESGVTTIGQYAFAGCGDLSEIWIPTSVTSFGAGAFYKCAKLADIYYDGTQTAWDEIKSGAASLPAGAEIHCQGKETAETAEPVIVPIDARRDDDLYGDLVGTVLIITGTDSVEMLEDIVPDWATQKESISAILLADGISGIGANAFSGCGSLSYVLIPESVAEIGANAFSGCGRLTSAGPLGSGSDIEFGWIEAIPDNAFSGSEGLRKIRVPEGVTSIGANAFSDCSDLRSVTLPKSLTSIDKTAFTGCDKLKDAYFTGSKSAWKEISGRSALPEKATLHYKSDKVEALTLSAGSWSSETLELALGSGLLTASGSGVVTDLDKLIPDWETVRQSVVYLELTEDLTGVGEKTFSDCDALRVIVLPEGLTDIGGSAFRSCDVLTSVTLPESLKSIDKNAFYKCGELDDIYFAGTKKQWKQIEGSEELRFSSDLTIHYLADASEERINQKNTPSGSNNDSGGNTPSTPAPATPKPVTTTPSDEQRPDEQRADEGELGCTGEPLPPEFLTGSTSSEGGGQSGGSDDGYQPPDNSASQQTSDSQSDGSSEQAQTPVEQVPAPVVEAPAPVVEAPAPAAVAPPPEIISDPED